MQNLANELPSIDADLTQRVARGFVETTDIITNHFRASGISRSRAASLANAVAAAAEGARTIARVQRSSAVFDALTAMFQSNHLH